MGLVLKAVLRFFRFWRSVKLRLEVARVGKSLRAIGPIYVSGGENIQIGNHCFLGRHIVLDGREGPIVIGDGSEIRDGARIYSKNIQLGQHVTLGENAYLVGEISIASKAWISRGCDIAGKVTIESAILGPRVSCVGGADHARDAMTGKITMSSNRDRDGMIRISEGSWIGQGAIILKGVTIGENAIVGAGAVVTKNIEPNTTCAGNPAKELRGKR